MPEIQVNPPLDGKKFGAEPPRTAAPAAPAAEDTVFGSLLARTGALAIDLLLLYLVARGANQFLREPLLSLGLGSSLLACLIFVAYYTLSSGPLGRGQSVGKYLMQIRVVGNDGRVLTFGRALKRSLVATAPVWGIETLAFAMSGRTESLVIVPFLVLMDCFRALFLSNTLCAALDPLRRSYHDLLVRSVVVKAALSTSELGYRLENTVAFVPPKPILQRLLLVVPFIVLTGLTILSNAPLLRADVEKERHEIISRLYKIVGTDEFQTYGVMRYNVAAGGEEAEKAEQSARAERKPVPDGPRALRPEMPFVKHSDVPEKQRQALAEVETRKDELRALWLETQCKRLDADKKESAERANLASAPSKASAASQAAAGAATQPSDAAGRKDPTRYTEAFLEVSFCDSLDLGFTFTNWSKPVAKFRTYFKPEEFSLLGIEMAPPASAPAASAPASAPGR